MATKVKADSYIIPESEYLDLVSGVDEEDWKTMYLSLRGDILDALRAWECMVDSPLADFTRLSDAISQVDSILENYPTTKENHD